MSGGEIIINPYKIDCLLLNIAVDDADILTSEVHDPYARTTGAWK